MKALHITAHAVMPLAIGLSLYWFRLGNHPLTEPHFLVNWILYSLPDGLWLYAFLSILSLVWNHNRSGNWWLGFAIVAAFASEIAQDLYFIPGTFDIHDLLAYTLAVLTFLLIHLTTFTHKITPA